MGEKSRDHQQLEQVQDESQIDVRVPEKRSHLWSRETGTGRALGEPFNPALERHGALMGEPGALSAKFPPASLPGSWSSPRSSGLHQVAHASFF